MDGVKHHDYELVLEPGAGANILFGEYRSGKTSICEFVRFALYGAEAVTFPKGTPEDAFGSYGGGRGGMLRVRHGMVLYHFGNDVRQSTCRMRSAVHTIRCRKDSSRLVCCASNI